MKLFGRGITGLVLVFTCGLIIGCKSDPYGWDPNSNKPPPGGGNAVGLPQTPAMATGAGEQGRIILEKGDNISVVFNDLVSSVPQIDDQIKEDGTITLYFNEKFQAAGKSIAELQTEIHDRYVPKYYKLMTPSVRTQERFFSIGGEIRSPGRQLFTPGMTVLRAIDAGGGFTDYSRRGRVIITRANGKQETENCIKAVEHPELDLPIYPGDKVFVKKRIL